MIFDLETTGVNVGQDHIVQICLHKVLPDGTTQTVTHYIRPVDAKGETVHIPEVTTSIHGISDADVAGKPSFRELAPEIAAFIGDADLAGYNSNKFDIPLLVEEFLRAFAFQAGITLHVNVHYGNNDHHKAEAIFKALGRALRAAVKVSGDKIPSTKGMLE